MSEDNKNMLLAIVLSMLVLLGWNYFYGTPAVEKLQEAKRPAATDARPISQLAGDKAQTGAPNLNNTPSPSPVIDGVVGNPNAGIPLTRVQALAKNPRIAIETPVLKGSINLRGGVLDDLTLKSYRETVDPKSENIVLLAPSQSPSPYYASFGWLTNAGSDIALPTPDTLWQADGTTLSPDKPITLTYDNGHGLKFIRKIALDNHFMFTLTDSVENSSKDAATLFAYGSVVRIGRPELLGYSVIHEGLSGVIGSASLQEITYDQIEKEPHQSRSLSGTGGWLGFVDKYWAVSLVPDQTANFEGRFSVAGTTIPKTYRTDILSDAYALPAGGTITATTRLFAGAKETETIDYYQDALHIKNFDLIIDWGWFYFITKPLFALIDYLYKLTGNFGVAILIITVLIKGLFFPLANASYRSMAKMKALQPKIEELKVRCGDDRQKLQQEQMELFRKEKVNPASGCLPMLVQIPVFFALYKVIFITIEMRQAPFFGWIRDLSAPDPTNLFNLFGLIPFDPTQLPLIGHYLVLGIWPIIMGFSMFIQMKMNPEPTDPSQKMVFAWMPVIFTFMLGSFPSGLVIYWTWNNLISVTQQYIIMRQSGVKVELWDNLAKMVKRG